MEEETKLCSRCKKAKVTAEFSKNNSTKDGLERFCRACGILVREKYKIKRSDPELSAKGRGRRKTHPLIVQERSAALKGNEKPVEAVKEILAILRTKLLRTRIAVEVVGQLETEIESGTIES